MLLPALLAPHPPTHPLPTLAPPPPTHTHCSTGEHFMAQEVEWDPTGRYVATLVNAAAAMENGFQIWSFAGQPLYK